jgi:hypothetical protein
LFLDLAKEQNEYVPPERAQVAAHSSSEAKGDRPGDEFNRRGVWADILEPHGWKVERSYDEVTYWTRPGKTRGVSATTGRCKSELGGDLLYVFTSNATPFDADTAYDKFGAYARLEFSGDLSEAAKKLRAMGYKASEPTAIIGPQPTADRPDDGVMPDRDFATNEDLRKLDLGVKWVWDKWLQFGTVNLLAAEGGLGKTRFMADLCRRSHTGEAWPDGTPSVQWDSPYLAMWVAGDRNHGELLELSEKFGFGDRICYSGSKKNPIGGVELNDASDFTALYRKVKAAKPLFLVIDTAGGSTNFNMARQEEAKEFFAPLSDMAVRLGLCVVVITHLNASKNILGKRAEERVRCVIRMTAENREPATKRRVEVVKSNSLYPSPIGMTLGEAGNRYDDDPPAPPDQFGNQGGGSSGDETEKGPPSKVRQCSEWLEDALSANPQRVGDLRNDAENRGFDPACLYRAKKHLKIIETVVQGYKWWALRMDD